LPLVKAKKELAHALPYHCLLDPLDQHRHSL
jgi:hypothetical protein